MAAVNNMVFLESGSFVFYFGFEKKPPPTSVHQLVAALQERDEPDRGVEHIFQTAIPLAGVNYRQECLVCTLVYVIKCPFAWQGSGR